MTSDRGARPFSRVVVPAVGIGFVALFGLLFFVDTHAYLALLEAWMLHPFPHPFIDWEYVPAAAECWSRGVDVYVATPCYAGPTFKNSYSPLWLRLSFLPAGPAGVAAFGLGWVLLFWASQACLPAPRTRSELRFTLLVALSSVTAFAVERGNVDLVIFLLALLGAALWLGSLPARLLAYAVFLVAGMLKFYPLILLTLVIRERPRVLIAVTILTGVILTTALLEFRDELVVALHNVPTGSYFTDLFGAVNLPFGLPVLASYLASKLGSHTGAAGSFGWISLPAYAVLVTAAVGGAVTLAWRTGLYEAVAALPPWRRALLLVGAALLCGCFFAGQSIGYRGIFMILLLPGLFELRQTLPRTGACCIEALLYAIVFVAWVLTLEWASTRLGLTRDYPLELDGFGLLHWLLHELAWWWIATLLLATLISFAAASPMAAWLRSLIGQRRQPIART